MRPKVLRKREEIKDYLQATKKERVHVSKPDFDLMLEYYNPTEQAQYKIDGQFWLDGKLVMRV